jgi:hypothetical protein
LLMSMVAALSSSSSFSMMTSCDRDLFIGFLLLSYANDCIMASFRLFLLELVVFYFYFYLFSIGVQR